MKLTPATLRLSILLALPAALRAQALHYPPERVPTLSDAFSQVRCTKTAVGEFTGDSVADVVALCDGTAVLTHAPALYGGTISLAENVSDLERWPGVGGARDQVLLASTTQGLRLARWDGGATPDGVVSVAAVGGLANYTALHVALLDLDGDGDLEIATTSSNGFEVSIWGYDGGAFGESPLVFSALGEVADIAALEWSSSNEGRELAVLSSAGLEVLADDGGELVASFTHSRSCTHPLLSVVPDLPSRERAAWIADGVLTGERVLVLSDVRGSEPDLSLGSSIPVVGISAMHLAPGVPPTLMVSHEHNHTLGMLLANPAATPPTTGTYSTGVEALAYLALVNDTPLDSFSSNGAVPAVTDFDNDGDEDIWLPVVSRSEGLLLPSVAISVCDRQPVVHATQRVSDIGLGSTTITLGFTLADIDPAPSIDTLEYWLWRVDSSGNSLAVEQSGTMAAPGGDCDLECTLAVELDLEERFDDRYVLQARLRGASYVGPYGSWSISGNVTNYLDDLLYNRACPNTANFYWFESFEPQGNESAVSIAATVAENIGGVIPRPRPPSGEPTPTGP